MLIAFTLGSETEKECLRSPLLFSFVWEVLAGTLRWEKGKYQNWKGTNKMSLFATDWVLCEENPNDSIINN